MIGLTEIWVKKEKTDQQDVSNKYEWNYISAIREDKRNSKGRNNFRG